MITKVEYAKNFIDKHGIDISLDTALDEWWFTKRTDEVLRLTKDGYEIHLKYKSVQYTFDCSDSMGTITINNHTTSLKLAMSKYMPCPYFLTLTMSKYMSGPYFLPSSRVTVFDDDVAILMGLTGDIATFLESQTLRL